MSREFVISAFEAMTTTSAVSGDGCADVPIDEQELPEPVRLRAKCDVPGEWEKLGRIRHPTSTDNVSGPTQTENSRRNGKRQQKAMCGEGLTHICASCRVHELPRYEDLTQVAVRLLP